MVRGTARLKSESACDVGGSGLASDFADMPLCKHSVLYYDTNKHAEL